MISKLVRGMLPERHAKPGDANTEPPSWAQTVNEQAKVLKSNGHAELSDVPALLDQFRSLPTKDLEKIRSIFAGASPERVAFYDDKTDSPLRGVATPERLI